MAELTGRNFLDGVSHLQKHLSHDLQMANNRLAANATAIEKLTTEIGKMSESTTQLGKKANWIAGLCAVAAIAQAVAAVLAIFR